MVYVGACSPSKLQASQRQGATAIRQSSLGRAVSGLSGTQFSAELLPRVWAQRLQVEMDAILGPQNQLGHLDGGPQGVQGELKAEQAEGCDHLHLIHGKLLPDAVPTVSSTRWHQTMGCPD